jgi:guanine deaminase
MTREELMREALRLALENARSGRGGPFAAVVARDGDVVATGANRVVATNDPTAHAEVVAIREACRRLGTFRLAGCEIYSSCEPCPMCLGAIAWARPARLFYAATRDDAAAAGFDDARFHGEAALPPGARSVPAEPLLREEAGAAFRAWAARPDRVPY